MIDCTRTRCSSLDDCSSANPACKDKELTSVVFIFDQMWSVLLLPKNCLKSKTCPMMVANVPHENIFKSVGLSACVLPSPYLSLFPKPSLRGGRKERRSYLACREIGFVEHSFPTSPTCLTCVTCLLYLCRAGFPVVAHLPNMPDWPDFPGSSGFPVVAHLLNLPLSIGFLHVPEAKCCEREVPISCLRDMRTYH